MSYFSISAWGVFPYKGRWGAFKHDLRVPEKTFVTQDEAKNWAMEQADPEKCTVIRIGQEDGSKPMDVVNEKGRQPQNPDEDAMLNTRIMRLKFLVETDSGGDSNA